MKRLLAILGIVALLGTLFVLASPSATADHLPPIKVNVTNVLTQTVNVTSYSPNCGEGQSATLASTQSEDLYLNADCNDWTVTGVDAAGLCTIFGSFTRSPLAAGSGEVDAAGGSLPEPPGNVLSGIGAGYSYTIRYSSFRDCVNDTDIDVEKLVYDEDLWAAEQGSFTVLVNAVDGEELDTGVCAGSNTQAVLDFNVDQHSHAPGVGTDDYDIPVLNAYIANNAIVPCVYAVTELVPTGWTLESIFTNSPPDCGPGQTPSGTVPDVRLDQATAIVIVQYSSDDDCEVDFLNELDHIPLTITKTFTGREYYTTVDRADFHLFTPGLCGTFPMDPFGGLLGSVGLFRTINASQLPQVVGALPDIIPAGPNGPCTYRVQENNAPEGCVAVDPDGSDADGPYWEQTWEFGVTTEMNFNIVNDCSEPTPTPTVAPTTAPKKPGAKPGAKKPSGGGTAAPKFTG